MKVDVDGINFNVVTKPADYDGTKIPLIFLHGFTGCANDWRFIFDEIPSDYYPVAMDLIGHGKTDSPEDPRHYSCSSIVFQLHTITKFLNFEKIILAGYSMGGRASLSFALRHPSKIKALILESTTPGIEDICDQKQRVEMDLLLADKIKEEGIEKFTDFWFNTPLFKSLTNITNFEAEKNKRNKNSVIGLANSLQGFSTGLMPNYWEKIYSIKIPVLLITGELDIKYTAVAVEMKNRIQGSSHTIIPDVGHNTHIEKPELFTKLVLDFLNTTERSS
jgi:2-succinyl-6-hydroxy-2,4-cyclohexadiene-1-carboxylate synthase